MNSGTSHARNAIKSICIVQHVKFAKFNERTGILMPFCFAIMFGLGPFHTGA